MQINKSESIAKLAADLTKAQQKISKAHKDSNNPFFKSKYADLTSVWDAIREPLGEHNLAIVQFPIGGEDGLVGLSTMLLHSSGEWIDQTYFMKPMKDDPQGRGSCLTYLRRYALQAVMGVCPEDDDGNAASGKIQAPMQTYNRPQSGSLTEPQLKRLFAISKQSGWKESEIKAYMLAHFQVSSTKHLTRSQYDQLCSEMEDHPKK